MYFLNINKPKGITSFDVIRFLRKKLSIRQIGHAGTLDPLASGVLPIGLGKAAKLLEFLDSDKTYIADIKFGYISSTYDDEGEKTFILNPSFNIDKLNLVLNSFLGNITQTPPKYSAIKVNGQKLCNLARKNIEIDIPKRNVSIYSIELMEFNGYDYAKIKVSCSKGTYIRTLAYDIGQSLHCGAYLIGLERISAGCFKIEDSNNLDDEYFKLINPIDVILFDRYELNNEEYSRVIHGNFIYKTKDFSSEKILLTKDNKLVSVANLSDNLIKPKKIFEGT